MSDTDTGIREQVMDGIRSLAAKYRLRQVILFGSRARGDYHRTSDIDLATRGGNHTGFALDVEEEVPTLLKFDVVNLDGPVQEALREAIDSEGVVIYEEI